ncbi:hypothetical protein CGC58_05695 [Capnocytophaga stomatis]|uniref:Uncharacterized protein n=2 Tax=Capnocytophaga stomatis TaxID=1848904 RepID=A0A250FW72_9FLAO|nr:DUF5522 domain-containing protein [Capnocytophaga stomatis]ATA89261.1 hypothetical protein CGC58_05695 [Capnocytophaga stomatis]
MQENKENRDFYYSEKGYKIFTEEYLLKRGYCCQSGCKHCPYGYNKNTGSLRKNKSEKKKWFFN